MAENEEGKEDLTLRVYSRRWGHDDLYTVCRTDTGWYISFVSIGGDCDPSGYPYLFDNLKQDSIRYPPTLGITMRSLWRRINASNLTREQIQRELNTIGAS